MAPPGATSSARGAAFGGGDKSSHGLSGGFSTSSINTNTASISGHSRNAGVGAAGGPALQPGQLWFFGMPAASRENGVLVRGSSHLAELISAECAADQVSAHMFATCELVLPSFKICTLDSLVVAGDAAAKAAAVGETMLQKQASMISALCGDDRSAFQTLLTSGELQPIDLRAYIETFSWNSARHSPEMPMDQIIAALHNDAVNAENTMKLRWNQYSQIKGRLNACEKKETGSIATRSLVGIVRREHQIPSSEFMCTVYVAVPLSLRKQWIESYQTLCDMVVPGSSCYVAEDAEYVLYAVVVFQKFKDEFFSNCRNQRFIPRDYTYDEDASAKASAELYDLRQQERELFSQVFRLGRANFLLFFNTLVHLRVIQLAVECFLRYGLGVQFAAASVIAVPGTAGRRSAGDESVAQIDAKIHSIVSAVYRKSTHDSFESPTAKMDEIEKQLQELSLANNIANSNSAPFVSFRLPFYQ